MSGYGARVVAALVLALLGARSTPAAAGIDARRCGLLQPSPQSYAWPVKPFHRPHPVRGNFGDPRTIFWGLQADDAFGGSFNFHSGVDISAAARAPVYAVASGVVRQVAWDEIIVRARGRAFQYWHLSPAVYAGEQVRAEVTVLGTIRARSGHVHLTEIDNGQAVNPLRHLRPFSESDAPVIRGIEIRVARTDERRLAGRSLVLRGRIWLIADAFDYPNLAPPPRWGDLPVTPALLEWGLTGSGGRAAIPLHVAVDFRHRLPPPRLFWRTYAEGTYQNDPVIGSTHARVPGRYLFDLTPDGLNTRRLPNGQYMLTVLASNICGNATNLTEQVRIENQSAARPHPGRYGGSE